MIGNGVAEYQDRLFDLFISLESTNSGPDKEIIDRYLQEYLGRFMGDESIRKRLVASTERITQLCWPTVRNFKYESTS